MLGRRNAVLRRLRELRRRPALRDAEQVLVAEGPRLVREALRAGVAIEVAVGTPRLASTPAGRALREDLERAGVAFHEASDEALDAAQDARSPQPVVCIVRRPSVDLASWLDASELVVVGHGIQEPGNVGSILRTADAAGFDGLLLTGPSADAYHPRAVRASAGAVFRRTAVRATLDVAVTELCGRRFRLVGADPRGDVPLSAADWHGRLAVVLGAEGAGLPSALDPALAARVRIPMRAGVESLSIGAAAAVLLFEAARARK
jgi:TrmH family RNA methyltransferase